MMEKFTFELHGDGKKIPVGSFDAETMEHAVKDARRMTKNLHLPGWKLYCVERGCHFPAVKFFRREKLNGLAFLKRPKPEFK